LAAVKGPHLLEVGIAWPPEPFLTRKLQGLAGSGLRVTVASPLTRRAARLRIDGIRLVRLPPAGEPNLVSLFWTARDLLALLLRDPRRAIRVVRSVRPRRRLRLALPLVLAAPDVVQFEWMPVAAVYLPLFATFECPVAVSCRGSGINVLPHTHPEIAEVYPLVFARANAVHCVSEAILGEAAQYGLSPLKARVIRTSVDAELFSPGEAHPKDVLRVVSVGALTWVKGHADGLKAVAQLVRDGVPATYEIIGSEPGADTGKASDREHLLFLVAALGLGNHVRLAGLLPLEEVRDRLRRSDVLLHPSYAEGIANGVLEAMACSLPVVVTDVGGMREAVGNGVEGLICPPRDPEALATALRTIWESPELAVRLGQAGRARVLADFTVPAQIEAFAALYADLTTVARTGARSCPDSARGSEVMIRD
jgi:colanic acid/amylovoran biosynthesis glycosyltransferase